MEKISSVNFKQQFIGAYETRFANRCLLKKQSPFLRRLLSRLRFIWETPEQGLGLSRKEIALAKRVVAFGRALEASYEMDMYEFPGL